MWWGICWYLLLPAATNEKSIIQVDQFGQKFILLLGVYDNGSLTFSLVPLAPVESARSLPAKSTRLILLTWRGRKYILNSIKLMNNLRWNDNRLRKDENTTETMTGQSTEDYIQDVFKN